MPLIFDENEQRYRIPSDYFLPPTNFTPEEALALIVLCSDLGEHSHLPFFRPAQSAALKLESSLPDRLRRQLRSPGSAIKIRLEPSNRLSAHERVYDQLVDAVAKRNFPVVQSVSLIFAATFILLNLAADVGAILTNPRLRHPK